MFSALPVAILAWVSASTSGLTRSATRAVRPLAVATGRKGREFGLRLDVEAEDVLVESERDLAFRLADTRERDAVARHAGGACAAQFTLRDDVHSRTEARQRGQHRLVGIGLDGVADERVEAGKRIAEDSVVAGDGRGGIAVEGRADGVGDRRQIDVFGVERAVPEGEVMHCGDQSRGSSRKLPVRVVWGALIARSGGRAASSALVPVDLHDLVGTLDDTGRSAVVEGSRLLVG